MKFKSILLFIFLFSFASLWGQINSKNIIQSTKFSLLDPNLKILLNNDLQKFKSIISHEYNLNAKNQIADINGKFYDINSNWFYIDDYGIINKSNSNIIYSTSGRDFDNKLQLLNDTLLLMQDGSILNLNSRKLLYDTIVNRFSKIKLDLKRSNQLSADKNNIILSDILFLDINKFTSTESYRGDIVFNLFKDSACIKDVRGNVNNNPNSKYILTGTGFVNRFDINDFVDFNSYVDDHLSYAYNDSLVYFSIKMDGIFNLLKIPLNLNLKDSITLNDIHIDYNDSRLRSISDKIIDYRSEDRRNKIISTSYFHKKYNSVELSISDLIDNPNYFNTFNSLLTYDPVLIVEYNYITKRVLSILDREVYPFQSKDNTPRSIGLNKLFLDNSNRYLIIQQNSNLFTIFDLLKKKEIITLSGIISGVNYNNELLLNIGAKSAIGYNYGNFVGIIQTKLDLNELHNLTESNYVPENNGKFKFDEFTSKAEFNSRLDSYLNKKNNIISIPTQFHNFPKKSIYSKYSNDFISKNISSTINRLYDTLSNNIGNKSLIYPLKYHSYSNETKDFVFITEDEQSLPQIDDSRQFTYRGYKTDYSIIDSSFKHDFKVSYNTITISDVSLQEAKEFRNGNYFFKKRSYLFNNFEIPTFESFFIFKYFSKIHSSILHESYSEIPIQDKNVLNKYFNNFVPFDATIDSNYTEWLFGTKDKFIKIGKVDSP
jgi:hypothetical protein